LRKTGGTDEELSDHMAEIINHYLMAAIGNQID